MKYHNRLASFVGAMMLFATIAGAQVNKTPNLGTTFPGSWSTDRYAPCTASLVPTFQGRSNVADIGVCTKDSQANRPVAFSASFYNTQGKSYQIDGVNTVPPASQVVTFDLWIDRTWSNSNTQVETGMWTRMNQIGSDLESNAWYPILEFQNVTGVGSFRYWDSITGWISLSSTVNYGAWNNLALRFTGTQVDASVNGLLALSQGMDPGTTRLTSVMLQDRNAGVAFDAYYSNVSTVPEPGTYALMAAGLAMMAVVARRRRTA